MRITERKVVTLEMEAADYGMLIDILEAAKKIKSKNFPTLNQMATSLLDSIDNSRAPFVGPAGAAFEIDYAKAVDAGLTGRLEDSDVTSQ